MSEEKLLRLPAAAKAFNVSVPTIVDFLKGKGFDVNPATKTTPEMFDLLKVAFQKDADIKEKAEKITLSKGNREDIVIGDAQKKAQKLEDEVDFLIKDSRVGKTAEKPAEKPVAKKEEPAPEPPKPVEPPVVKAEEKVEEEVVKATPTKVVGPKIVGKMDLDKPAAKGKAKKAEEPAAPVAPEPAAAAEEPAVKPKGKKAAAAPTPEPVAETPVAAPEPETPVAPPTPTAPVENPDDFRRTEKHTLTGPKIIGKIELPTKAERPAPAAKPAAAGDASAESKRRRKRIKTERITLKDGPDNKGPKVEGHRAGQARDHRAAMPGKEGFSRPGAPGSNPLIKTEVSEKEIQEKIKNTLAKLGGSSSSKGKARAKMKRSKRDERATNEQEAADQDAGKLQVTEFISVSELASLMNVSATEVISKCMQLGVIVSINQRLDAEVIELVASEFNYEAEFINLTDKAEEAEEDENDAAEDLTPRAPIVTVMGHVDHGKTSLLDYIRKANVVAKEAGGITQHIGAYEVTNDEGKKVVFLDTPGHEAFTAMRARGAKVTDVAIIVIAADDQVMPQTKEAISHAQAAGVPMIFAFNKMDKDGANSDNLRQQLSQMNILVEEWGGKFQSQEISAKKGMNIDKLLEKVLLEAELLDLKANADKPGRGTVIEASLDKGRGYIATVLVSSGTLRQGDMMVAGTNYGKIKAMFNEKGVKVREAGPSTAVLILGLDGAPQAGDLFKVYENESEAKQVTNQRQQIMREQGLRTRKHITLDEIGRRLALGTFKELNVIIKGDFDGSVQALKDSLLKLSTSEVQVNIVHSGVGQITESDILLASASDAVILGFQVRPSSNARKLADKENIEIRLYSIIYDAIEEIKTAMEGMLSPKIEETITGMAEVREVFKITNVGTVAGCVVTEGKIIRGSKVRLIRDGIVVYSGEMAALKRFKDDVKDVITGQDCGISIKNFSDIQNGDNIEGYTETEVKRKL